MQCRAVHMMSGMRGAKRRGSGLRFENSYDPEAHRGPSSPKGVRVRRACCAELLRSPREERMDDRIDEGTIPI